MKKIDLVNELVEQIKDLEECILDNLKIEFNIKNNNTSTSSNVHIQNLLNS